MSYSPSPNLEIEIQFSELIKLRRKIFSELFSVDIDNNTSKLILPYNRLILFTVLEKESDEYLSVAGNINKAVSFFDMRVTSHNFSDSGTWGSPQNSLFSITPFAGTQFIIPQIVLRFPVNAVILDTNPVIFNVYLSYDGVTPVNENTQPVVSKTHSSLAGIIRETNDYIGVTDTALGDMNEKCITAVFRYADLHTMKGSPIVLRSALSERLDIYIGNHQTIKDINSDPLTDECTAVFYIKFCIDF